MLTDIYRMDVRQMVCFHQECKADVSTAARPVPIIEASSFGILEVDDARCIQAFQEKPAHGKTMPSDSQHALVSMGNYIFNAGVLSDALEEVHQRGKRIVVSMSCRGCGLGYLE